MQTGGRAFNMERARSLREAGLDGLGVSVDGPAPIHDRIRGNLGSHHAAIQALKNGGAVGMVLSANTQVNRLTADHLVETERTLRSLGVQAWQPQLTGPLGRAADHPEWILAGVSGGANSLWLTEWLTEALDLRPGMRVLDLGCGRGASSIFLRREFGVQVWATDLWFSASERFQRIRDAGVEEGVFPISAEARSARSAS